MLTHELGRERAVPPSLSRPTQSLHRSDFLLALVGWYTKGMEEYFKQHPATALAIGMVSFIVVLGLLIAGMWG